MLLQVKQDPRTAALEHQPTPPKARARCLPSLAAAARARPLKAGEGGGRAHSHPLSCLSACLPACLPLLVHLEAGRGARVLVRVWWGQ